MLTGDTNRKVWWVGYIKHTTGSLRQYTRDNMAIWDGTHFPISYSILRIDQGVTVKVSHLGAC